MGFDEKMASTRAALIAAIRDAPDDDDARLICADWFEDQGDEANVGRAEFIRTQLQSESLAPNDPRQVELYARELRLLKAYGRQWCGSHFLFKRARFRRGFIEYVHLHLNHYLHHRRQLAELEPVRDVSFTGWYRSPVEMVERVARCEELSHLEKIRIHHQGPHKHPRGSVLSLLESPNLRQLKKLELETVELNEAELRRFELLPVLRQLEHLTIPNVRTQTPQGWFQGGSDAPTCWSNLKSLSLGPASYNVGLIEQLAETQWWTELQSLDFECRWHAETILPVLLQHLPEGLHTLRLVGSPNEVFPQEVGSSFISGLTDLELKYFGATFFSFDATTLATILQSSSALKAVSLMGCQLNNSHVRAIAEGSSSHELYHLDLSSNSGIGPAEAELLFSSENLTSVIDLDISGTNVGETGTQALVDSSGWEQLRILNVAGADISSDALTPFIRSSTAQNLNWLTFGDLNFLNNSTPALGPALSKELTRLPHLAGVLAHHNGPSSDVEATKESLRSESLVWPIVSVDDGEVDRVLSPDCFPPLDDCIERHWSDLLY